MNLFLKLPLSIDLVFILFFFTLFIRALRLDDIHTARQIMLKRPLDVLHRSMKLTIQQHQFYSNISDPNLNISDPNLIDPHLTNLSSNGQTVISLTQAQSRWQSDELKEAMSDELSISSLMVDLMDIGLWIDVGVAASSLECSERRSIFNIAVDRVMKFDIFHPSLRSHILSFLERLVKNISHIIIDVPCINR